MRPAREPAATDRHAASSGAAGSSRPNPPPPTLPPPRVVIGILQMSRENVERSILRNSPVRHQPKRPQGPNFLFVVGRLSSLNQIIEAGRIFRQPIRCQFH